MRQPLDYVPIKDKLDFGHRGWSRLLAWVIEFVLAFILVTIITWVW